eukprot:snap_masked-scaffold_3-processed-gene-0.33-mRNA-1 protein AED:1.00 eAED:1.00 QI:0/0/0/0/1/1/3/0/65
MVAKLEENETCIIKPFEDEIKMTKLNTIELSKKFNIIVTEDKNTTKLLANRAVRTEKIMLKSEVI